MLSIIAAKAKNDVIGRNGDLAWHLSGDLKHFKEKTRGHIAIMGSNTFASLPGLLPGREHWVLTSSRSKKDLYAKHGEKSPLNGSNVIPVVRLFNSVQEVLAAVHAVNDEIFVIGGADVYRQFMEHADRLYITEIEKAFDGDVIFPAIDQQEWEKIETGDDQFDEECDCAYRFVTYDRKQQN